MSPAEFSPSDAVTLPEPARAPAWAWLELGRVRHLQWSPYTLAVPGLPKKLEGLRVVHLTDLHVTPAWMPAWDRLHERLAADPPDLIVLSGDLVEHKHDPGPSVRNVRRFLRGLTSRLGTVATLGNHDGDVLPVLVPDWPVRLLCNETLTLREGDGPGAAAIEVVGFHGVEPTDVSPRVLAALPPKPPGTLRLVSLHYPVQSTWLDEGSADVVFAGHTHGGQVCLPGGVPLITHDPLPRRFARGVHRFGGRWLVVGRGLGFSTYPVRTFCPAEAIEITLVAGEEELATDEHRQEQNR